jgi:hypothetical protein
VYEISLRSFKYQNVKISTFDSEGAATRAPHSALGMNGTETMSRPPLAARGFPEQRAARGISKARRTCMPIDDRNDAPTEPGPQPDPMLDEGPASATRKWAVTGVIAAVLLAVMYGVTTHRAEVKDEQRQIEIQKDAAPSASTQPGEAGGRGTANAPPAPSPAKPGG